MTGLPAMTERRALIALFATCAVAMALPAASVAAPVTIHGDEPTFTAVVPDGFVEMSGTRDDVFVFGRRHSGRAPTVITLRPLRSTIANLPIDERAAREAIRRVVPEAQVSLDRGRVMDLEVPLVVTRMPHQQLVISATLPSSPRALELSITGDAADEAAVRQAAHAVMQSFRSRTNWLTRAQVQRRNAARAGIALAWALLIGFGLAWAARFRKRPDEQTRAQALWLAASGAIFLASAALLASVPPGSSAFGPGMPGLVGLVVLINAVLVVRSASKRTAPVAEAAPSPAVRT